MNEDLKRMEAALLNAEKAGDVNAAKTIAAEMRIYMQRMEPTLGMPEPLRLGSSGMGASMKAAAKEFGTAGKLMAGIGSAPALAAEGVKGMFNMSDPDSVAAWRAVQRASPETLGGNIAGNALMFGAAPTQLGAGAIRGGALAMGAKAPQMVASRPWMVGDTVLTSGALNAATEPGTLQDRTMAGLWAMGSAGAVPALYAAGAGGRRMLTPGGKRIAVGEGLRKELGDSGSEKLLANLHGPDPAESLLGVRSSAAVRTGESTLEALESGSRAQRGDLWRPFDQENARARWDSLVAKAGTPEELAQMKRVRDGTTGEMRETAMDQAHTILHFGYGQFGEFTDETIGGLKKTIQGWRTGPFRPNKDVQKLADYIEGELAQGVRPEQLYEIRKTLTDGIKAGRNDELSSAIKAARMQRVQVVQMIDNSLDKITGGGWSDYLKTYSAASKPITSKQAMQDVVTSLQRGQAPGEVPAAMTSAWKTVGNLRDQFGQKEIGSQMFDRLLPEDRRLLDTLVDNLKRQQDAMTTKATVGSPTAGLLANTSRASNITQGLLGSGASHMVPGGGLLAGAAFDNLGRKAEAELARLLQDPAALAEAIKAAERAEVLRRASSRFGAATGGAASQYPR